MTVGGVGMKKCIAPSLAMAGLLALASAPSVLANDPAASGNVDPLAPRGKVCALVVGISDYAPVGPGGPDLNFADDDADDVVTALTTVYGVRAGNITLLKDSAATKPAILRGLEKAKRCTGPRDDLFVFLSGHGTNGIRGADGDPEMDNAFVAHEANRSGLIVDGELARLVSEDDARRRIVLGDFSFPSGFNDDMARAGNILYIAAAKGEEFEFGGDIKNGVFTYKFVQLGIIGGHADNPAQNPHANGDGLVTLEEAFDYANHVIVGGATGPKPDLVDPDPGTDVYLGR